MKELYKPKVTKGFGCAICGIFLPKNTVYMRTRFGYIWASAYDVKNYPYFSAHILRINDKNPVRVSMHDHDYLGGLLRNTVQGVQVEKPVQVVNKQTLGGLAPKNVMVSKAYAACAVYAGRETKTKKDIEWRM